jgi:hypothetical protein
MNACVYTVDVAATGGSCSCAVVCGVACCVLTGTADKLRSWLPPAGSWRVAGLWCLTRNSRTVYVSSVSGWGPSNLWSVFAGRSQKIAIDGHNV